MEKEKITKAEEKPLKKSHTGCSCGYEFTGKDLKPPTKPAEHGKCGGRAERYCEVKCPECKRKHKLYFTFDGHRHDVILAEEI
jgi:hypothetical protein